MLSLDRYMKNQTRIVHPWTFCLPDILSTEISSPNINISSEFQKDIVTHDVKKAQNV